MNKIYEYKYKVPTIYSFGCGLGLDYVGAVEVFGERVKYYGIDDLEEAREYMENEYLGNNLIAISNELLKLKTNDPVEIFGHTDSKKLRSSMTLFELVSDNDVFSSVLEKYFDGERDQLTLDLVK